MKRLMIFRHGKSDWYAGASSDHERPLNKRGTRDAGTMGALLTEIGEKPDLIYTSSAVRANETAILAVDAGEWDCEITEVDELYGTSAASALAVAARAPDSIERLMLVGHEPTWGQLVRALTGAAVHMKTGTVAGIDLSVSSWLDAAEATGTLAYLLQPKLFKEHEL